MRGPGGGRNGRAGRRPSGRELRVAAASDPALRAFVEYWVGRGAAPLSAAPGRRGSPGAALGRSATSMRIALAQLNTVVGDLPGNEARVARAIDDARERGRGARPRPRAGAVAATRRRTCCSRSTSWPRRAPRSTASPPRAEGIVALVGFPERDDDVYNAAAVCADGAVPGDLPQACACRTTASSTRSATSRPAREPMIIEVDGVPVGLTICEDIWCPARPRCRRGARRRAADRQHQRLALPRRQGRRARADDRASARATACCAMAFCATSSAARTSWSSTARAWSSTTTARSSPAPPQFAEDLLIADVDTRRPASARLRDTRPRRPSARRARASPTAARFASRVTADRSHHGHDRRRRSDPSPRSTPRSSSARATTSRKNGFADVCIGLSGGIDSTLVAARRRRRARGRAR